MTSKKRTARSGPGTSAKRTPPGDLSIVREKRKRVGFAQFSRGLAGLRMQLERSTGHRETVEAIQTILDALGGAAVVCWDDPDAGNPSPLRALLKVARRQVAPAKTLHSHVVARLLFDARDWASGDLADVGPSPKPSPTTGEAGIFQADPGAVFFFEVAMDRVRLQAATMVKADYLSSRQGFLFQPARANEERRLRWDRGPVTPPDKPPTVHDEAVVQRFLTCLGWDSRLASSAIRAAVARVSPLR